MLIINKKGGIILNSYWINSCRNPSSLDCLKQNISTDVCIIGAGIFGLITAYYLSKKGVSVAVIDKSGIGEKASGHTTAKITSQHGLFYSYLVRGFWREFRQKIFVRK